MKMLQYIKRGEGQDYNTMQTMITILLLTQTFIYLKIKFLNSISTYLLSLTLHTKQND
jgi:hypothetical protein